MIIIKYLEIFMAIIWKYGQLLGCYGCDFIDFVQD